MEKYIAIFFLPFILSVLYSIRRYDFLNLKIATLQAILFVYSIVCSYLIVKILKTHSYYNFSDEFKLYWWAKWDAPFLELILWILFFSWIFCFTKKKILPHFQEWWFSAVLEKIKVQLPFITNLEQLNRHLNNEFSSNFNIQHISLHTDISKYSKVVLQYFNQDAGRKYFINDIVFLEENKNKFWNEKYVTHKKQWAYIIFPLRNGDNDVMWVLEIGPKPLWDPFYTSEIRDLELFSLFLQWHLKYLSVYNKMQDLSINLDKQVDEKTIEYNNLLAKQKEFIAFVGHEIKNPITNSIFLCDNLKDELEDIKDTELSQRLREDGGILYGELLKVWDLVKHIFSTEQFDLEKVKLYRKPVNLHDFLLWEIQFISTPHAHIKFEVKIAKIWEKEIDVTQFRQVFHNLLSNAIKFTDSSDPRIYIEAKKQKWNIYIQIEDNGRGFDSLDAKYIFDKYATGHGSAVWLGMGLYLCKKIVELHGGSIEVWKSKELSGACFCIKI